MRLFQVILIISISSYYIQASQESKINIAMNELDRIGPQLNLSKDIKESSAFIYRKALSKGITKGRSIIGIISASILDDVPKL